MALAQESNDLFPELQGQFKPAPEPQEEITELEVTVEKEEAPAVAPKAAEKEAPKKNDVKKQDKKSAEKAEETPQKEEKEEEAKGVIKVEIQNVKGVLTYARTMSYCSADVALTNESNLTLNQLSMVWTYKDMQTNLNFSGVQKGKKQTRNFMLIGLPCEGIMGMPDVEFKKCKLGSQSEEACKKRVQITPPSG